MSGITDELGFLLHEGIVGRIVGCVENRLHRRRFD